MPDEKQDRTLECVDCREEFVFSVKDQAFFERQRDAKTGRPWDPPKRCKPCRDARKNANKSQGA